MHPFLTASPYEADCGNLIGRDPRDITGPEWADTMPDVLVGMKAIRAKRLDCAHTASEVRKCVQVTCPLWALRMGGQPKALRLLRKNAALDAENDAEGDDA